MNSDSRLYAPLASLQWVSRTQLQPNDYNPNAVSKQNLALLKESILMNGWTLPIVIRPDWTIIDGFHRWMVSGEEPLVTLLSGQVPVVTVHHTDEAGNIYGTVTHNRARGTHQLAPMRAIIRRLIEEGQTLHDIQRSLGMTAEEVFRLSDFDRDDFLALMAGEGTYSSARSFTYWKLL